MFLYHVGCGGEMIPTEKTVTIHTVLVGVAQCNKCNYETDYSSYDSFTYDLANCMYHGSWKAKIKDDGTVYY